MCLCNCFRAHSCGRSHANVVSQRPPLCDFPHVWWFRLGVSASDFTDGPVSEHAGIARFMSAVPAPPPTAVDSSSAVSGTGSTVPVVDLCSTDDDDADDCAAGQLRPAVSDGVDSDGGSRSPSPGCPPAPRCPPVVTSAAFDGATVPATGARDDSGESGDGSATGLSLPAAAAAGALPPVVNHSQGATPSPAALLRRPLASAALVTRGAVTAQQAPQQQPKHQQQQQPLLQCPLCFRRGFTTGSALALHVHRCLGATERVATSVASSLLRADAAATHVASQASPRVPGKRSVPSGPLAPVKRSKNSGSGGMPSFFAPKPP